MKISVDISYYPLSKDYKSEIIEFISRMNRHSEIQCITNGMSTQVFGEYENVFSAIHQEMKKSFEFPHSVFVMKFVNADLKTE